MGVVQWMLRDMEEASLCSGRMMVESKLLIVVVTILILKSFMSSKDDADIHGIMIS